MEQSIITVCEIVDKVESVFVVHSPEVCLCDGEPNTIGKALTKRPRSDFDACDNGD